MRLSRLFGRTLREAPTEAENIGYQLALRAGLTRQTQAGSFALLPLGMAVLRQIEAIMHEELAQIGGQEFRTPIVQSVTAWQQTGRHQLYGPLILNLHDREERALMLAPTHEEAVAELARREVLSYRQLPQIVYQIHTKYRDEARVRGGMMRMREFTMLDAYTLDADADGLDASYELLANAFERIFTRAGLRFVAVEASAGEMGGREPREYMALSASGEDMLVLCDTCGYAANLEVAQIGAAQQHPIGDLAAAEHVATPNSTTIADLAAFLGISAAATAKAVFFDTPERGLVFAVVRGDREVNEIKLRAAAGVSSLVPASAEQIAAAGAVAGYASPVGVQVATTAGGPGVFVIADQSVVSAGPLVAGANKAGYHLLNVLYGRDWQATMVADIATAQAGDACVRCGAALRFERGVEVGHIFKLGTGYTSAIGAKFLAADGSEQPIVMGSYGIGLERMIQLLIEQHHDERGIIWPEAITPAEVQLLRLGKSDAGRQAAEALYAALQAARVRVIYDDRDESPGVKFNDADLIGLPLRVVVSDRLLANDQVEVKPRGGEVRIVDRAEFVASLRRS